MLQSQLEFGNKWNKISKRLTGRCENSVKNHFNTLYKKFGIDHKTHGVKNVNEALNVVNEEKKTDQYWISKLIEEKQKKLQETKQGNTNTPPLKLKSLRQSSASIPKFKLSENPASTPYPSTCFLDKMKKQTTEILARSERFINPATSQELFFTDKAIYLYNEHGYLIPFTNIYQIKRNRKLYTIEVEDTPASDRFSPLLPPFGDIKYSEINSMFSPILGNFYNTSGQFGFGLQAHPGTSPMPGLFQGSGSTGIVSLSPYAHTPL